MRRGKHIPAILGLACDIINSAIVSHDERVNLAAIPFCGYLYANLGFAGISIVRGRRGHVIGHYSAFNSLNACYFSRMLGRSQRRKVGACYANGIVIVDYGFVVGGNIYCSISLKPALNMHIRSGIDVAILHARANNAQYHANLLRNLGFGIFAGGVAPYAEHRANRVINMCSKPSPVVKCIIVKLFCLIYPRIFVIFANKRVSFFIKIPVLIGRHIVIVVIGVYQLILGNLIDRIAVVAIKPITNLYVTIAYGVIASERIIEHARSHIISRNYTYNIIRIIIENIFP